MLTHSLAAQKMNCAFKPPVVNIHFGRGPVEDINDAQLPNYSRVWDPCPNDGFYTFATATSDCFQGDWFTLKEDHTPDDVDGNMMLVNATPQGGLFLHRVLHSLKAGVTYNFSAWMMNVCHINGGCPPLPSDIIVKLTALSGKVVMEFRTGQLTQTAAPQWTQYQTLFTMPAGESAVVLTMVNTTTGGCGNDFALDDITIRECVDPRQQLTALVKLASRAIEQQVARKKLPAKEEPRKDTPVKPSNRPTQVVQQERQTELPTVPKPEARPHTPVPVPPVLLTRENPLVKEIETEAGEIKIDLYDNGVVDGDTVSIYHNNELIVSGAPLSQKPITFRIKVDAQQPRHELIMVAHNLGSIPPNTSLMIVTAGDKRYEAFISSSEQKNAKVVIQLKQ